MKRDLVFVNGRIVSRDEAAISPLDRGFLYGDGFFETLRVFRGRPFLLEKHLDRLCSSCIDTGWGRAPDRTGLAEGVARLIERNGVSDGYLRITVSRGLHGGQLTALECEEPTVFIEARQMSLPSLDAPGSLALAKSKFRRNESSPVVRHKSLSYQGNLLALAEGRRRGADEVFFLNSRGHLSEGAITNLFFVRDGRVFTPDVACGLLPGVTREAVMGLCESAGIPIACGEFTEADLQSAHEVFCTNSLRGIVPVARILDYPQMALSVHEIAALLQKLYAQKVRAPYCEQH